MSEREMLKRLLSMFMVNTVTRLQYHGEALSWAYIEDTTIGEIDRELELELLKFLKEAA